MRSINVKRVAAVAAGSAMVLSTLASGLAAPVVGAGVADLLKDTYKPNIDRVQVVVGADAAISDGIAAARIAATLANIAYTKKAVTVTQGDPTVTTTGTKSVTTSGAGAVVTVSAKEFPIVYTANTSAASAYQATTTNRTLTPTTLSGILSTKKIQTYVSNQLAEVTYEEQIQVLGSRVQYTEAQSPVQDHGLYLSAAYGNLVYRLAFLGSGLQTNVTYSETPTITMLGQDYSIDTTDLLNARFTLYSGEKKTLESGSTYTTADGYKIDIIGVGQVSSTTGTTLAATVSVTSPTGSVETATINSGSGRDFFVAKVSVYIESAMIGTGGKNLAVTRIGTGKKTFTAGLAFPLDDAWTIKAVTFSGNYLTNVDMQYGKPTATTILARGQFDGTATNGLKQGVVIPGPKNAAGKSLFDISLKGFGGTSTVDTATVTAVGVGDDSAGTDVLQVTWTDTDGLVNKLEPSTKDYASIASNSTNPVTLTTGTTPYTVVGNTVLYFDQVRSSGSGATLTYTPYFKFGGVGGTEVAGQPVAPVSPATTANSTLTYLTSTQSVSCSVLVTTTTLNVVTVYQSATCDLLPDAVSLGPATLMDQGTAFLDLRYIRDGDVDANGDNVTDTTFPQLRVNETAGPDFSVIFDSSTTTSAGNLSDTTTGLVVFNTLTPSLGSNRLNITGSTALVNQPTNAVSSANFEPNAYQITPVGTEIDGATANKITFKTPEARRDAYVSIAETIAAANVTTGDQTVLEGGVTGGVTIKAINCPTTTAVKGNATALPSSAKDVTPITAKTMVVTDASATAAYQIVVGGPYVNKVAAAMSPATRTKVTSGIGASVVEVEGTKLLVAGYLATDTLAAADELVKQLELLRE